ncbi:MAG: ribosome biogenesis GTPase Der [Acidimicrobiales bacterium]
MNLPVVAIVGRPNVGKSTLVNRIIGRREAIVEERPGVTRDRKAVDGEWQGHYFTLLDTGGWMADGDSLDDKVSAQSEQAMRAAEVVVLVVDATVGVTPEDEGVALLLRRSESPVIVVANKVDDAGHEAAIWEFMGLGLGEPFPVSALHGKGTGDLLDHLISLLPEGSDSEPENPLLDDPELYSVSLVGRPNVGKSTLFNRLIGEERAVVHDRPGTTRDAIDTIVETETGPIRFVDTAGMRRKAKIDEDTEYYSLVRALKAVDESDVALLVIDATIGVTHQDQRLAERVDGAGCPIVVVLNKWELLNTEQREQVGRDVERKLGFLGSPPVLRMSALSGKGVNRLWPQLQQAVGDYRTRIPTRDVNKSIRAAQSAQPAPHGARVLYATQGATDPPTFTLFANRELPPTYIRYLERKLREDFDLGSTPIKLRVRRRND